MEAPAEISTGRWLWEWVKSFAVAFVIFIFVRTFVVEAFQIPTGSMENTLLVGDYLLVNKAVYGAEIPGTDFSLPSLGEPGRGDIVVFRPPPDAGQPPGTNYVKRIVGGQGDTLSMRDGVLYRNGRPVEEPYVRRESNGRSRTSPVFAWQRSYLVGDSVDPAQYRPTRDAWGPLKVPDGHFFVMGDNRNNSEDSRYWGFVPREDIRGDPLFIYYSYDRGKLAPFPWLTEVRWGRIFDGI
jgi:signal peptidase I